MYIIRQKSLCFNLNAAGRAVIVFRPLFSAGENLVPYGERDIDQPQRALYGKEVFDDHRKPQHADRQREHEDEGGGQRAAL